jgi:hypothetical protein
VDENTDPSNCGGCGISCNGGICASGQCTTTAAIQVVTGLTTPFGIAVDGANLYVTDSGANTVWQIDKTSFAKTSLGTGQASPARIAVDGTFAYWTSNLGSAVLRAPIGAATAFQPVYSTAAQPVGIAVDASNVYWSDSTGIHAAPKGGGGPVKDLADTSLTGGAAVDPLVQDATSLYGLVLSMGVTCNNQYIGFSIDKATAAITRYGCTGTYQARGPAVDGTNYYFFATDHSGGSRHLGRLPIAGGTEIDDPVWANPGVAASLAAEPCAVYWGAGNDIFKMVPDGSTPLALTRNASQPGQLVVDSTYVYWVDQGFIGRVAK